VSGVDTPLVSADGGVKTDVGRLVSRACPRRPCCVSSGSAQTNLGFAADTSITRHMSPVQRNGAHVLAPAASPQPISYLHHHYSMVGAQSDYLQFIPHLPPSGTKSGSPRRGCPSNP